MLNRLICFCFLISFCAVQHSIAQVLWKPDYAEAIFNTGILVKNYPTFPDRIHPVWSGNIRFGVQLNGNKQWHKYYNYPSFGFQIVHASLGNKKQLGNLTAVLPDMTFSWSVTPKWKLTSTLGLGGSYCTEPFNVVSNEKNILIGSHITFFAMGAFGFEKEINKNLATVIRVSAFHASNSHTKLPNVGANVVTLGVGLVYRPLGFKENLIDTNESFKTDKRFNFTARFGYGFHQRGDEAEFKGKQLFPVYVQQLYVSHNYHPIARYQIGIEGFYKQSVYDTIQSSRFYGSKQLSRSCSVLLILGHELLIGHFSLLAQGGLYLYNPYYRDIIKKDKNNDLRDNLKGWFTSRLGFNYYFKNSVFYTRHQFFTGIYIKTNFSGADFLETGLGYIF